MNQEKNSVKGIAAELILKSLKHMRKRVRKKDILDGKERDFALNCYKIFMTEVLTNKAIDLSAMSSDDIKAQLRDTMRSED